MLKGVVGLLVVLVVAGSAQAQEAFHEGALHEGASQHGASGQDASHRLNQADLNTLTDARIIRWLPVALVGLFLVQRKGTEFVGTIFGPVMLIWFIAIALLGIIEVTSIVKNIAVVNGQSVSMGQEIFGLGLDFGAVLRIRCGRIRALDPLYHRLGQHIADRPTQQALFSAVVGF